MGRAVGNSAVTKGSVTSSFGTVSRRGHDSSAFYSKKVYAKPSSNQATKPQRHSTTTAAKPAATPPSGFAKDIIHCADSRQMSQLPAKSVALMITSPPYNVGKEYDDDLSLEEYSELLSAVFAETFRVLCDGGRACINIANIGRKPYIPLHALIIKIMDDLGFIMRGEIIWDKAASAGSSCAWGSWRSASNPVLRDVHEYILIYSKGTYQRNSAHSSTIDKQEFLDYTKSIWTFPAASARQVGHPAPFPVELPRRLIQLYSFQHDLVLDPFMGSGTTALAALKSERHYVGYDLAADYVKLAEERLAQAQAEVIRAKEQAALELLPPAEEAELSTANFHKAAALPPK